MHTNASPQGQHKSTQLPLNGWIRRFLLSEGKTVRATSSVRKGYKTFRMQIAGIEMESIIQQVNKGNAKLSEDIVISWKMSETPLI